MGKGTKTTRLHKQTVFFWNKCQKIEKGKQKMVSEFLKNGKPENFDDKRYVIYDDEQKFKLEFFENLIF